MNLENVITLSTGEVNIRNTRNRIQASPECPSFVEAVIYNKSDFVIKLHKFEVFDSNANSLSIHSVVLNRILIPKETVLRYEETERTEKQKIVLSYGVTPYFVWIFEYENKKYRVGNLWRTREIDVLEVMNMQYD